MGVDNSKRIKGWSIILSDFLVVVIESGDELKVLYEDDAEEFAYSMLNSIFSKLGRELKCRECNAPLTPDNLGQLTLRSTGELSGKCLYCLDQELIRTVRQLEGQTSIREAIRIK